MESFDKAQSKKICIVSEKYSVEKVLLNGRELSLSKAEGKIYFEINSVSADIQVLAIPKYFESKPVIKTALFFIENALTGSGLSRKELQNEIKGIKVCFNSASFDGDRIDLDCVEESESYTVEAYTSDRLKRTLSLTVHIPICILSAGVIAFFLWAILKIVV